ncbi:hypothetical protein R3W88_009875 [Solanum pinnatisectum]|uniref:Fe2OG dioxygenase domain-containing protein n=1 Tax=Solanum pinnatisectum TaxID=50273 RepID=A0AAV9MEV4_9SOLN|nr:hypothetical protein R3W88_009875 [Solanum pinnatisectum]
MASFDVPTIDVSPFYRLEENEEAKKKGIEQIREIANHEISLELLSRSMDMYKTFFASSDEEKLLVPHNYFKSTQNPAETYEHFAELLEEMGSHFKKLGVVLEGMISECLGLPPNFLTNYKNDQCRDTKQARENLGCFTVVYQDEVGGLEVHKNGQWIPIALSKDKLVVNIGDVIQVLSNNRFKSATHRVVRPREANRYSCTFFYNVQGDKWVEPLPQFTKQIGESPKYRGFLFGEYMKLRIKNMTHLPDRPEDLIHITHYSISN